MAFTYEPNTDRGRVRFAVGDRVDEGHLLEDGEIDALLEAHGTVNGAAVAACEGLSAQFSRQINFATDDQKFDLQSRAKAFRELAAQLRAEGGGDLGTVETVRDDGFAAGIGNEQTEADIRGGRIRAGYEDPDIHP